MADGHAGSSGIPPSRGAARSDRPHRSAGRSLRRPRRLDRRHTGSAEAAAGSSISARSGRALQPARHALGMVGHASGNARCARSRNRGCDRTNRSAHPGIPLGLVSRPARSAGRPTLSSAAGIHGANRLRHPDHDGRLGLAGRSIHSRRAAAPVFCWSGLTVLYDLRRGRMGRCPARPSGIPPEPSVARGNGAHRSGVGAGVSLDPWMAR